ncbi:uncharacterized protein LOC110690476 [Chenopodium quinoa]|uniref:uncharacterized protein LOC110690476 n=1 Tax=Chenopodium quinoa TaxID=63459 RepID=UPI000B797B1D|nr:uncharacterized protein LOC110690476 [Chenopodium quinoa]
MTMVPAPKLSKPHLVFYGGCGAGADVMTRFADGCSAPAGYVGYDSVIDGNTRTNTVTGNTDIIANSKLDIDNVGIGYPNNNNYDSYHNIIFRMAEEDHSRTSNSTSVNDDGDHQQAAAAAAAAAASSTSMKGRDDTPTPPPPPHHHQRGIVDSSSSWLQLGLGRTTHVDTPPLPQQHPAMSSSLHMGGSAGGLMLELSLGGGGGSSGGIPLMIPGLEQRIIPQKSCDHHFITTSNNLFTSGGVIGSPTTYISHQQHHPMIPLIASIPQPQQLLSHHQQQHQTGWGFANQRAALSAAAGCSSSLSPSSSSSMPPAQIGAGSGSGSFLTRPFTPSGSSVVAVDSEFRVLHPPPRRPHTGIWFALQASLHQSKEPFLPQVSKSFLRIKDERMTVRLVMKYVANKLGLDSESEVEIRCKGQQLVPYLTLQHVRDNIWSSSDAAVTTVTLLPDSSTTDHLMVLNYGRSTSSSSTSLPLPN